MKNENIQSADEALLRKQAEEKLKKKRMPKVAHLTEGDMVKLVHELDVHRIELEMQNEELRIIRDKAKTATEKYSALYDFTSSGYFTLDTDCRISWLNLSGARLLGRERSNLVNKYFKNYITLDTLGVFNDFFLKLFNNNGKETCEVRMIIFKKPSAFVQIEGILSEDGHKCLITMVDITRRKSAEEMLNHKVHELRQFNDLMVISDLEMIGLKKEINLLLQKLGEKNKFRLINAQ
jgi:hypothetical protein